MMSSLTRRCLGARGAGPASERLASGGVGFVSHAGRLPRGSSLSCWPLAIRAATPDAVLRGSSLLCRPLATRAAPDTVVSGSREQLLPASSAMVVPKSGSLKCLRRLLHEQLSRPSCQPLTQGHVSATSLQRRQQGGAVMASLQRGERCCCCFVAHRRGLAVACQLSICRATVTEQYTVAHKLGLEPALARPSARARYSGALGVLDRAVVKVMHCRCTSFAAHPLCPDVLRTAACILSAEIEKVQLRGAAVSPAAPAVVKLPGIGRDAMVPFSTMGKTADAELSCVAGPIRPRSPSAASYRAFGALPVAPRTFAQPVRVRRLQSASSGLGAFRLAAPLTGGVPRSRRSALSSDEAVQPPAISSLLVHPRSQRISASIAMIAARPVCFEQGLRRAPGRACR